MNKPNRNRDIIGDAERLAGAAERATAPVRDIAATGQRIIVRLGVIAALAAVTVTIVVVTRVL